jgi:two-component system, NtrC family, response regulator AtoC
LTSRFTIQLYAPMAMLPFLKSKLPPISEMEVIQYPEDHFSEGVKAKKESELALVWIDNRANQIWRGWIAAGLTDMELKDVICVGKDVDTSHVLHLGRLGIQRLFDLETDPQAFARFVLEKYENSKLLKATPEKKSAQSIEELIIGDSPAIRSLRALISKVTARERLTVLVRGETGSGKGLVARSIHELGDRRAQSFIEINCSAIPETLVEAELFGHERGSFTDAHRSRRGIFELAHGGTLFLDEIGYLKQEVQVKLLKALEDKRFRRIGGEKDIQVDCRIIAGTSVDLEKAVQQNEFRSDLYYRLNIFPIRVPPLRERSLDIMILAEYFRKYFCREHHVSVKDFSDDAKNYLMRYAWPGNVRELKHAIERAVILSENETIAEESFSGVVRAEKIKPVGTVAETPSAANEIRIKIPDTGKTLEEIQREVIQRVLDMANGNRSQASRLLKISRSRLLRKIGSSESE